MGLLRKPRKTESAAAVFAMRRLSLLCQRTAHCTGYALETHRASYPFRSPAPRSRTLIQYASRLHLRQGNVDQIIVIVRISPPLVAFLPSLSGQKRAGEPHGRGGPADRRVQPAGHWA